VAGEGTWQSRAGLPARLRPACVIHPKFASFITRRSPLADRGRSIADAMTLTFDEQFCSHYGGPLSRYQPELLARALHPAARWLRPLVLCFDPHFFDADMALIARLAQVTRVRDLILETRDFLDFPADDRFLRRQLRLRLSVGRLRDIASLALVEGRADRIPIPEVVPSTMPHRTA
jgi:hypothetical protein